MGVCFCTLRFLPRWLAWSPKGKQIAYPESQPGDALGGISLLDRDSGKIKTLTFADKAIWEMAWSPDGDGLFVIYQQKGPNFNRWQIGYVALSDGQLRPISRDTNSYATLSLSTDGRTLATVQQKVVSNFYVLPGEGSTLADVAPSGSDSDHIRFFDWGADGSLLTSDLTQLMRRDANRENSMQVVSDPAANILSLTSCGTQFIVFPWAFHNGNSVAIWRINADGSNPIKLADERVNTLPVCSANSNWVYYWQNVQHLAVCPWMVPGHRNRFRQRGARCVSGRPGHWYFTRWKDLGVCSWSPVCRWPKHRQNRTTGCRDSSFTADPRYQSSNFQGRAIHGRRKVSRLPGERKRSMLLLTFAIPRGRALRDALAEKGSRRSMSIDFA